MADNELRNWAVAAYAWILAVNAKLEECCGGGEEARGPGGHPVPPPPPTEN
jgi:hypothetical protein